MDYDIADIPGKLLADHIDNELLEIMVKIGKNGCYNREPLKTTTIVQSGWINDDFYYKSRKPLMVEITDPMSKECEYSKTHNDIKCKGCKHDAR